MRRKGGVLLAAELFPERPVPIIAAEEIEAIAVECHGDAVLSAGLTEHGRVAVEIFGRAEPEGERDGGGIVDKPMQGGRRPPVLEPGEGAGVELASWPIAGARGRRLRCWARGGGAGAAARGPGESGARSPGSPAGCDPAGASR